MLCLLSPHLNLKLILPRKTAFVYDISRKPGHSGTDRNVRESQELTKAYACL
jgi:hypothetical protein